MPEHSDTHSTQAVLRLDESTYRKLQYLAGQTAKPDEDKPVSNIIDQSTQIVEKIKSIPTDQPQLTRVEGIKYFCWKIYQSIVVRDLTKAFEQNVVKHLYQSYVVGIRKLPQPNQANSIKPNHIQTLDGKPSKKNVKSVLTHKNTYSCKIIRDILEIIIAMSV